MLGKNNLILILVVILIAVCAGALIYYFSWKAVDYFPSEKETSITLPPATGNLNDLVTSLIREIEDENQLLLEEDSDLDLITSDSEEIKSFDQSFNENEL